MKRSQKNFLYMAQSLLDIFERRESVWEGIPLIVDTRIRIAALVVDVNTAAKEQTSNSSVGYTAATDLARSELEGAVFVVCSRMKSFAMLNGDTVTEVLVNTSRSALGRMSLVSLLTFARTIIESCREHMAELEDFMITPADMEALQEMTDHTSALNARRNSVTGQRTENTSRLEQLFKCLRKELILLDSMVRGFISDEEFLKVYFNVRKIHDFRGGVSSSKPEEL